MFPLLFLPLPLFFYVVGALLNVTVDDTDASSITYQGPWESYRSSLNYGGSHTLSTNSTATATFTFTGVAVYYLVPRWPYPVNTQLSLDGGQGVIVNLTDPNASTTFSGGSESALSSVTWSATDLSNTTHTLVLSMASTGQVIVADGFIFTVNNGSSPSSSSASSTAPQTPTPTKPADSAGTPVVPPVVPMKTDTLAIALGCALGAAALLAAALLAFFICRRQNRRPRIVSNVLDDWGADADTDAYPPPPVPFVAGAMPASPRPTHVPSMSDASTGPLLATPWEGHASSTGYLPPGARAAEPGVYDDMGELASGSGSISRALSSAGFFALLAASASARREKARPFREEVFTPAPPKYSDS
ncbi:hypothetical protein DFH09DRAFT_1331138 [Mycena vulgaris]|nr:hypothetical protein DFH09DRAFT_1331138 [Mycena vulgaris]